MKSIVVYYSLEGNTKYVGDKIAEIMDADLLRLEPVKPFPTGKISKFFWGGRSAVFGQKPKLKPYEFNKDNYDIIIIGTPVWAGRFTPPIKTFISENDLSEKDIGAYVCNAGGSTEKCFRGLKKDLGVSNILGTLCLIEPGKNQSRDNIRKIEEFCKILLEKN